MSLRLIRRFVRCTGGASVIEFALLAPVFIAMMVGLVEYGRAYWTRQTLEEVAYVTARCMALSSLCSNQAGQRSFAVDRATRHAIPLAAANVITSSGVTCRGQAGSHSVALSTGFTSPLQGLGVIPETLRAEACFPTLAQA